MEQKTKAFIYGYIVGASTGPIVVVAILSAISIVFGLIVPLFWG